MTQPLLVPAAAGRAYSVVGDRYVFKATGAETGGAYALFDFLILPGNGSPPHVHSREDEGFQIVEGELTFYIGHERKPLVARAGDYVHAPKNVPHFFRNESGAPVRMLCLVVPAGLENFFAEAGVPLPSPDAAPVPPDADQIRRLLDAAPRYGLEIFSPGH